MHATVLCLAMATLGVDVGWRPLPEGGMEYIIQIEPHMLGTLAGGQDIFSDIPPNVRGVRSYRITVGSGELPREGEMAEEPAAPPPAGRRYAEPSRSLLFPQGVYREPTPMPGPEPVGEAPSVSSEGSPSASPSWETPRPLRPPADPKPLPEPGEKPALFVDQGTEPGSASPAEPAKQHEPGASGEPAQAQPQANITLALVAFCSFGGMMYTGWLAWGYRRQYRSLLERMVAAGHATAEEQEIAESGAGDLAQLPPSEQDEPA